MLSLAQAVPFCFAALFPVLNPIGSSFIILSVVNGSAPSALNKLAYTISLYTAMMLIVVLFLGSWVLMMFGITIPIVLIGGGLILANIGWQMLNEPAPTNKTTSDSENFSGDLNSIAFYPLTMPITAGPGCIAVVIALGAHSVKSNWHDTLQNLMGNAIGIILVAFTVYLCYRYTHVIANKIGQKGTAVIMKLAAFFNLCIGLELITHGVTYLVKSF